MPPRGVRSPRKRSMVALTSGWQYWLLIRRRRTAAVVVEGDHLRTSRPPPGCRAAPAWHVAPSSGSRVLAERSTSTSTSRGRTARVWRATAGASTAPQKRQGSTGPRPATWTIWARLSMTPPQLPQRTLGASPLPPTRSSASRLIDGVSSTRSVPASPAARSKRTRGRTPAAPACHVRVLEVARTRRAEGRRRTTTAIARVHRLRRVRRAAELLDGAARPDAHLDGHVGAALAGGQARRGQGLVVLPGGGRRGAPRGSLGGATMGKTKRKWPSSKATTSR